MNIKTNNLLYLVICAAIFLYLCFRAYYVPIVYDEATSFFMYIQKGQFLPYVAEWDANNHYANSLLTIISVKLFGESLFALRLPNLLFFPVFALYAFLIAKQFQSRISAYAFLICLVLAHNFIEFFALSRGYGISMALLAASVYYLVRVMKTDKMKDYILGLLMLSCAVASNLNLLITSCLIILVLLFKVFVTPGRLYPGAATKRILGIIVFGIVPAAVFMLLIFKLRSMGLLYYGDGGNLWESTLRTLTLLIAGTGHPLLRALAILLSAIVFIRFVMLLAAYIKTKKLDINGEFVFSFLFTGNVAAMIAAHFLLGVKYPEDRTAMHLFPLLIGSVLFFFDRTSCMVAQKWKYFALLPVLLFPAHFIFNANLTHASWWSGERIPQLFYEKVRAAQAPGECPATIAGYFLQAPQWSYLNYINGGSQNQLYVSGFPSYGADFQLVDISRNPLWLPYYDIVARDEISGFDLLKRKKNVNTVPVYSCSDIGAPEPAHEEFLSIFELRTDSLAGMSLKFCYDLSIQAEAKPFRSCIVVSVSDENDHVLIYEKIELDQIRRHWNYDNNMLRHAIITEKIPEGMVHIKTYLWNMDLQTYSAIGTCELFGWASD